MLYGGNLYGGDVYTGQPGLNAFEYRLGIYQGRIKPDNAVPADGMYDFCIGSDEFSQVWDIAFNDHADLEQTLDLTNVNYIRAIWRVRQPLTMPNTAVITGAGLLLGGDPPGTGVFNLYDPVRYPIPPSSNEDNLHAVVSTVDTFLPADLHRIVRVAGAGGNNGDKRITGVLSPRIAILDGGVVATANPLTPGTATLIGARWRASLSVGGVERATITETPGRDKRRIDLVAHVSKIVGAQPVRFRLQLVEG